MSFYDLFVFILAPMILVVLGLCGCSESLFPMLKQKIQRLHELTRFSTYYELFGVGESAGASEVKKAFRKLKKLSTPPMLSREQYDELLMNGYNVLNTYRMSYDKLLQDSRLYFFDDPANYRNHILATSIALICALLCLDFVIYAFRYLKYTEGENAKRSRGSGCGKTDKSRRYQPPTLYSAALLIKGAKLLGVRK